MSCLIKNGTIVTMSPDREIIWNGAVYVEQGRIVEVGPSDRVAAKYESRASRVIDADWKVVYPGFINLHTHGVLTILRGQAEDEDTFKSVYEKMFPIAEIMTGEDCYHVAKLAFLEMLKFGSTTIADTWGSMDDVARAAYDLGVRVYVGDTVRDADATKVRHGVYEYDPKIGEKTLRQAIDLIEKWHMKGDGRIRCTIAPHGTDTCSPELLKKIRETADKYGVPVTVHLAQNRTEVKQVRERRGMCPAAYLERTGILGPDFIGAHGIFLTEEDFPILARTGSSISYNAVINAKRGYIAPIAEMLEAGVNVGLGTDNMAGDILEVMRTGQVVSRIRTGVPTEPKPEKMLEMATINGARALGVLSDYGSVEAGKVADLVIVDYRRPNYIPVLQENVVANLVHTGLSSDIDTVMVGGDVLVEGGRLATGDEDEIIANAQRTGEAVWKRWKENRS